MVAAPRLKMTDEEFLAFERVAETKHEFYDGEVFAMAGASENHNVIVVNLSGELRQALRGRPCRHYVTDLRVRIGEAGRFTYPDAVVVCGDREFLPGASLDTLLNPTVIVEVLSPSTEAHDRGRKFDFYREIASLRAYVLVSQSEPRVGLFERENGMWRISAASGLGADLRIETLGITLALAELYLDVDFPPEPPPLPRDPNLITAPGT